MNFGDILNKLTALRFRAGQNVFDLLDDGHGVDQCTGELMADFVEHGLVPEALVDDAIMHPGSWVLRCVCYVHPLTGSRCPVQHREEDNS